MRGGEDRNFDDLAVKFSRKIYASQKGEIRLAVIWRDLLDSAARRCWRLLPAPEETLDRPLRVLELGGGLGQFSCQLAAAGHCVTYNDLSANMLDLAQQAADQAGCREHITWRLGSYQHLASECQQRDEQFDLILCHAMIEWLAEPSKLIASIAPLLAPSGQLSLSYYNLHGWAYRNLLRGNFKLLENPFQGQPGSLSPQHALVIEELQDWMAEAGLAIVCSSGVRVFSDYTREQRGGLLDSAALLAEELKYSTQEPFKWLGRYIHLLAERST